MRAVNELLLRSGPFEEMQFETARRVLDAWKGQEMLSPACVNAAVALLERLVHEVGRHGSENTNSCTYQFLVKPLFFNPVLNQWKETVKRCARSQDITVVSPQQVLQLLFDLNQRYTFFQYDRKTLTILLNVVIALEPNPAKAPYVAASFFQGVFETQAAQHVQCQPSAVTYSIMLKVWADSGLPEASKRMDKLMERALACGSSDEQQSTNDILYHIWFRFWAERGEMDKLQACLARLQQSSSSTEKPSPLTLASWTQVVYGYCQVRNLDKAAQVLQHDMIEAGLVDPNNNNDTRLVGECLQHIVFACRRAWDDKSVTHATREQLLHITRNVVDAYARPQWLGKESLGKCCLMWVVRWATMLDAMPWISILTFNTTRIYSFGSQNECGGQ